MRCHVGGISSASPRGCISGLSRMKGVSRRTMAYSGAMRASFEVNGKPVAVEVEPRLSLADCLRHSLGLTGTHLGCEHGVCGACTVLVDGEPARACLMFMVQAEGARIVTVEGLSDDAEPTPL